MKQGLRTRLPKWAQEELSRLEGSVKYLQGQMDSIHSGSSRISFGYGERGTPKGRIPETDPIFFRVGAPWDSNEDGPSAAIQVSMRGITEMPHRQDMELWISGGDGIEVIPHASNAIVVRLRDDRRFERKEV